MTMSSFAYIPIKSRSFQVNKKVGWCSLSNLKFILRVRVGESLNKDYSEVRHGLKRYYRWWEIIQYVRNLFSRINEVPWESYLLQNCTYLASDTHHGFCVGECWTDAGQMLAMLAMLAVCRPGVDKLARTCEHRRWQLL